MCLLRRKACLGSVLISPLPMSVCKGNPCNYVVCVGGTQCVIGQNGLVDCVCGDKCKEQKNYQCPMGQWGTIPNGCQQCLCSKFGAKEEACDRTTGQCYCKSGHSGHKCNICPKGHIERPWGCGEDMMADMRMVNVIEDECEQHTDCKVKNSHCMKGKCKCRKGFLSSNQRLCKRNPFPCSSNPCGGGGTCEEHDGTFTCYCGEGMRGRFCEERVDIAGSKVASFSGTSFAKIRMSPTSLIRSSIKIKFVSYEKSGQLFYNRNPKGDFLKIELNNFYLRAEYLIGNFSLCLTSLSQLSQGEWHQILVQRYRGSAKLKIDHLEPVYGEIMRTISIHELGNISHIGGLPSHKGFRGLKGCIKNLEVNKQVVSLVSENEPLLLSAHNVSNCKTK